ncbi:MAG TPA: Uma2 family endonuclease [Oscillatoriaceae cyanobacterium M33_DOE_052]|uniref:Uma2 family endonuclease n=1 Tax=Planktothricoides sp. SpSt-374 TaxID=2282167 RepID=A0A7C3ZMJ1_9CYAN|nr:Uma2 family endonuclease [Oscillatoriaceae cyanobacterium M33_DOE_052]
MIQSAEKIILPPPFPDHTQLPDKDGTFVKNFQAHPQAIILTDSIAPVLAAIHPDGQYAIGQDCGIYWRETEPPEQGAEAPDWFYVPNVPPNLDGKIRRSYVFWREFIAPLIALELASGDGAEERDRTPLSRANLEQGKRPGKFWVYEQIIRIPYYGIYVIETGILEMYQLDLATGGYQPMSPNERGHYPIDRLGVELGLWEGAYQNQTQVWLRWWDSEGNLLLTGWEQTELERLRVEQERQRAEQERQRAFNAERSLEAEAQARREAEARAQDAQRSLEAEAQARREAIRRLLAMGLTPEQVAEALGLTVAQVRQNQ